MMYDYTINTAQKHGSLAYPLLKLPSFLMNTAGVVGFYSYVSKNQCLGRHQSQLTACQCVLFSEAVRWHISLTQQSVNLLFKATHAFKKTWNQDETEIYIGISNLTIIKCEFLYQISVEKRCDKMLKVTLE